MPKYLSAIAGAKDTITRPIVFEILREVMRITGVPVNTQILFPGENEAAYQPGSTIDAEVEFNKLESKTQWRVEVEEVIQEDTTRTIPVHQMDHREIFWDNTTKTYLKPVYAPSELTLTINYRAPDKDSANRWASEIRARNAMLRDQHLFSLSYSYMIPLELFPLLHHIHSLREAVEPYGESWDDWVCNHFVEKASVMTTLLGTEPRWAISETQTRILGWFEFETEPDKGSKEGQSSAWTTGFTYKVYYDKPISVVIDYPLVVHNQLIDSRWRPELMQHSISEVKSSGSMSNVAQGKFEVQTSLMYDIPKFYGVSIPHYDEFIPRQTPPGTKRVFMALTSLDEASPLDLLSLLELGDYQITDEVIAYLRADRANLTRFGYSFFHLSVYRDHAIVASSDLEVRHDLMLRLKSPSSFRHTHRVRMSLVTDPSMLNKEAIENLRKNYPVCCTVLKELNSAAVISPALSNGSYPKSEFAKEIQKVQTLAPSKNRGKYKDQYDMGHKRVMSFFIQALRDDQPQYI